MGAVITNTLCRIMMAVVHIVHYTSGCHTALANLYVCVLLHTCVCVCASLFLSFSCFSKLTSEPLGRKIYHHLPSVTNNIFWIMIASIGLCICKCEVMNFLCEQWKQTDILCHFAWAGLLDVWWSVIWQQTVFERGKKISSYRTKILSNWSVYVFL